MNFKIRDNSLNEFMKKFAVNYKPEESYGSTERNPYYLMKDNIFIKKEAFDPNIKEVVFELSDQSRYSEKQLINYYKYDVYPYDDVSIMLDLVDFKIKLR